MNSKTRPRIVIADDDANLLHALTIRCTNLGLKVHGARDASMAWHLIEEFEPDIVVLDVEMPAGNGLSVSEMISHHEQLKNTPVVMLTGRTDHDTIRRCHQLMSYYVTKCDNVWERLEPLLREILGDKYALTMTTVSPVNQSQRLESSSAATLMDAVSAALGGVESEQSVDYSSPRIPWVLCIEDDPAFADGLKLRLKQYGVEVLRAAEGVEGYRRAFTSPADVILLDHELPNGNGDYVLGRLKDNPVTSEIPVIVLTGRRDKTIERKMYSLGAVSFMTKPYDWSQLWQEIRRYLPEPAHVPV
jgi:DNA-binding response OmpR family regulator